MMLKTSAGVLNLRSSYEVFHDDFARSLGPLEAPWRGFHEDDPDMFDEVGIVSDGIATIALNRPANGGGLYVPNPANTLGAYEYGDYPGYSAPGIGGAYIETNSTSVVVDVTYGGHYEYAGGLHAEATAALHVTPGTDLYALGVWFARIGPVGVSIIGGVCRPPEDIYPLAVSFFALTEGVHHVLRCDSDGTGMMVFVDGVQLSFDGGIGYNRYPIPPELLGSTKHGFEIDQHIVDYTDGAPDLTRLATAVAVRDIKIITRG